MRPLLVAAVSCVLLVACSERGPQGPAGEAGVQGVPGPTGPTGPQGPPGEVIVLDGGTLMGPQGPRGESLKVVPLAPGQACATGGVRLDYEDGGVAAVVCNGVTGSTGPQGPAGPAGASVQLSNVDGGTNCPNGGVMVTVPGGPTSYVCNGAAGPQGATGAMGPQGPVGATGAIGPQGLAGATGATGATGAQGLAGPQGPQGIQGAQGPQGVAGPQGPAGLSVVSTPLNYGDATCPYGGSKFVVGTTTTYACNGAPGGVGPPGAPGGSADGGYLSNAPGAPQSYSFAGFTAAAYTGNLGGVVGANAKCHAEFPNSYLCTYREYQWTASASAAPAGGAWVDDYAASNGYNNFPRDRGASYTCSNWTSGTSGYGSFVNANGLYDYLSTACATARPLTCCRSTLATFRGFTSATYAGNLGGPLGAHAKCQAEFPGSHMCTYREYQWAGSPSAVPVSGAWVDDYASSSGYNNFPRDRGASYTCSSWTSSASGYGSFVNTNGHYDYLSTACATPRPITCCGN